MAFIANGTDSFARQFLGTTPVADTPFTTSEYTTAVALHMGVPIQAIKNCVGEAIRNNPNCQFSSVDHYGHNLTTVAGSEGGGITTQLYQIVLRQQVSNTWEEQQTAPAKPYSETLFPLWPLSAMIRTSR